MNSIVDVERRVPILLILLQRFVDYLADEKNASQKTRQAYEKDLSNYLRYLEQSEGIVKIEDIMRIHVKNYIVMLQERGFAATSVARAISSIRSFHRFLVANRLSDKDPSEHIATPTHQRILPDILSKEEVDILLAVDVKNSLLNIRNKAMLEVLYATGLKASELCRLKVQDVHIPLGFIQCVSLNSKERVIPIGGAAKKALQDYLKNGRPKLIKAEHSFLFINHHGAPLSRQGFWKVLKQVAKEAKIQKPITPQILRNSFAAHMLENGADVKTVSELLGHRNISNTLVYLQQPKIRLKDTYSKFHPRA